jgi:hypothetical protein
MDESQFQRIMDKIGELKRRLLLVQVLAAFTLGFLLALAITGAF